jgi:hypothetical protein
MIIMKFALGRGEQRSPLFSCAPENQDLGVVKYLRKPVPKLDLSPFPLPPLTNVQFSEAITDGAGNTMARLSLVGIVPDFLSLGATSTAIASTNLPDWRQAAEIGFPFH